MDSKYLFICDAMLGRLAKWLRLIGYDTLYFRAIDDLELIRIAKQEQRIILTRDTALSKNKKVEQAILIQSNYTLQQLREVLSYFKISALELPQLFCRCINCNGELIVIDKQSALNEAPEYVFLNKNSFLRCQNCGKVFWYGSHKKMIDETIEKIFQGLQA